MVGDETMSKNADNPNFMIRPILVVDIVGFSQKRDRDQIAAIRALIQMLGESVPAEFNDDQGRIWSPAGDGGILTFLGPVWVAVETALSLAGAVKEFNSKVTIEGKEARKQGHLQIRLGLHSGPVIQETDFDGRSNIWGNGTNIAARVAGFAKPGQILISEEFYKNYDWPSDLEVTRIGTRYAKHRTPIVLYNISSERRGVGTPHDPSDRWPSPHVAVAKRAAVELEMMAREELDSGSVFRSVVIVKRLLDLDPFNRVARSILAAVSSQSMYCSSGDRPAQHRFFSRLSSVSLENLLMSCQFKEFAVGDHLVEGGEEANSMMFIVAGEAVGRIGGEHAGQNEGDRDIFLREGDMVGEMGLFSSNRRRSATFVATTFVVVLSVGYSSLNAVVGSACSEIGRWQREVREQMWNFYVERTVINAVADDRLFTFLTDAERAELIKDGMAGFLPRHYEDRDWICETDTKALWHSWILVVSGGIGLVRQGENNNDGTRYGPRNVFGPLRLALDDDEPPFSSVEYAPNTHLIRFGWRAIRKLMDENSEFFAACLEAGVKERLAFKLVPVS